MIKRAATLAAIAAVSAVAAATPASASVSVASFALTPAGTQAGASPDVTLDVKFSTPDGDTVKDATLALAPGLLANPTVPSVCQTADFARGSCPSSAQIGDGTVTATVPAFGTTLSSPAAIYLIAPQGSELARIGVSVQFFDYPAVELTAPIKVRSSPTVGADIELSNLPNQVAGIGLRIDEITMRLYGTVDGQPFTRLPTSCGAAQSQLMIDTYGQPASVVSANSSFTPTGCGALSYNPQLATSATLDSGDDGVSLASTITQDPRGAATATATLTLPGALAPRVSALTSACGASDLASCPAVGTATVWTPLLGSALSGKLVLAARAGLLPSLDAVFPAPFAFILQGTPSLGPGGLQVSFAGLPDVPLARLAVDLAGGPGSLLTAGGAFCSGQQATSADFSGQNGTEVHLGSPLSVAGCGAGARVLHAALQRHKLRLTVLNARTVSVLLAGGLRFKPGGLSLAGATPAQLKLHGRRLVIRFRHPVARVRLIALVAGTPRRGRTFSVSLR